MTKIIQVKNKATLLLISAILVLCIGFIIAGCGAGPQFKVQDPNAGQFAIDFTDCPIANQCSTSLQNLDGVDESIEATALTYEAWIKPKSNSDGTVLKRGDAKKGALLHVSTSGPDSVVPRFEIRRVQSDGTSSVAYLVEGTPITINSIWTHIAGILVDKNGVNATAHAVSHVIAGVACTGVDGDATDDPWHLDLYQGGTLTACAETYTGNPATDDTPAAEAYAHEPENLDAFTGITFGGIIDETRIWTVDRAEGGGLSLCMNRELDRSGDCGYESNMVVYARFNEGEGHLFGDFSGIFGSGGKEYPNPDAGGFLDWNSGWTTDSPF
jgi:hypothetical protein